MDKTLILGECKWDRHPIEADVLRKLIEKTALVLPRVTGCGKHTIWGLPAAAGALSP